jgi:hypothetical protein
MVANSRVTSSNRSPTEEHVGNDRPLQNPGDPGPFRVGPHIVSDGKDVFDVGALELIHRQDVTAYKFQKCPPEAVGM